ncbi:MAG: hypothetical protein A2Y52_08640 [Sulfuricurvum sp. RIFCSPLOWO2_02_43_6]|nr:MAG: hypothetical protein A2Y52_08640 [Sulfuricurvum sp. RIFCSPLOWO2_02_43_6]
MKILLFNDNPVVRKLVALSAQKTKDDLIVIWSVDEIQESDYDLLIIDDALYSDELFQSLKELVSFKATLLMATRGKAVPAGFDNVINKPFLPTDLVDMFIKIDKKTMSVSIAPERVRSEEPLAKTEVPFAIHLDEALPDMKEESELDSFDFGDLDDEIDLGETLNISDEIDSLEDFDDTVLPTAILDKEEVQEVQNLLDDTESDDWNVEEEIIIKGIDEPDIHEDDLLNLADEPVVESAEELSDEFLLEEEPFGEIESFEAKTEEAVGSAEEESELGDLDFDLDNEMLLPNLDDEMLLDDDELGDLETQIQDAVNDLGSETLDKELDLDDFKLDFDDTLSEEMDLDEKEMIDPDDLEGFDELDMLDERELKLAIGEEVEEESEADDTEDDSFADVELLSEDFEEPVVYEAENTEASQPHTPSHAEGVEALQALLKALSNEEVAKSLKGLNISININFGNEQ